MTVVKGVLIGSLAHGQGHHQFAVSSHYAMVPLVTGLIALMLSTTLWLFFT
jgi:hypothetical protein